MTDQQQSFLKKLRQYQRNIRIARILLLFTILGLWELCANIGLLDDFIFSSPSRMLTDLARLLQEGNLLKHIGITLAETFFSFFLVIFGGLLIAILLWSCKPLFDLLEPLLVTLNSLPKSALAPVLIVWLGTGYRTIIVTAVSVSIFGTILSLYTSFIETEPEKIKLITTLGGGKKDILSKLILPGCLPTIVSSMKVNIGLCLVGVIIAEFLVAKAGLGYVIIYNSQIFKMDTVLLSICILCGMATLLYQLVNLLDKIVNHK